ncbi:SWIM zinc finger protein [Phlyctema vagabunda]|uniref:SWIM zinc finger protein n=1 Tax=Phlyctema vagabunda TaxID=108571 RepID=A0ABR4P7R4_9HELO
MSAPTSSFSNLSISPDMERASTQRTRRQPQDNPPSDSEEDSEDEPEGESEEESEEDEDDTLVALDWCGSRSDQFCFRLVVAEIDRVSIFVKQGGQNKCSCDERDCEHLQWLKDQFEDEEDSSLAAVYQRYQSRGLKMLAEKHHWDFKKPDDRNLDSPTSQWELKRQDPSASSGEIQATIITPERKEIVRDIMATLSPSISEEYRTDIFEGDFSFHNLVVPRDLETTICRLLLLDDKMLHRFENLVSEKDRAMDFFYKREVKVQHTFDIYDEYVQHGPKNEDGEGECDSRWCAKVLVNIAESIKKRTLQFLDTEAREHAAHVLVMILQGVVARNFDVSEQARWPYRQQPGETEVHRNLYTLLVNSNEFSPNDDFLVDVFWNVRDAARPFVETLEDVHYKITTADTGSFPSAIFMSKLNDLIAKSKKTRRASDDDE